MTDRRRLSAGVTDAGPVRRCLLRQIGYAIEAAIDVVQIRERDLEGRELSAMVSEAVAMTRGTRTRVVVNDHLDVALATGADGVHLRADSIPLAAARSMVRPGFVVGVSVHTVAEAMAVALQADYVVAGTVWPTVSKPGDRPLIGLRGLAAIVRAAQVPVLAIGGVTIDRVTEVAAAGASGVAGIGLFLLSEGEAGDPGGGCLAVPLSDRARTRRGRFDTVRSAS